MKVEVNATLYSRFYGLYWTKHPRRCSTYTLISLLSLVYQPMQVVDIMFSQCIEFNPEVVVLVSQVHAEAISSTSS